MVRELTLRGNLRAPLPAIGCGLLLCGAGDLVACRGIASARRHGSMNSVRVVLDTNILVSACWKPEGLEAQVVDLAIAGKIIACVSAEILAEYRDVLSRRKLVSVYSRRRQNSRRRWNEWPPLS